MNNDAISAYQQKAASQSNAMATAIQRWSMPSSKGPQAPASASGPFQNQDFLIISAICAGGLFWYLWKRNKVPGEAQAKAAV